MLEFQQTSCNAKQLKKILDKNLFLVGRAI